MNLSNYLPNEDEKVIAESCTLGQVFTMIDNWCYNNNAKYDWIGSYKDAEENEFCIFCYDKDNEEFVNEFIIWN